MSSLISALYLKKRLSKIATEPRTRRVPYLTMYRNRRGASQPEGGRGGKESAKRAGEGGAPWGAVEGASGE